MGQLLIRNEKTSDYAAVENITREAFWNQSVPGCDEHYLVHVMREHEDFVPELDLVAELDGTRWYFEESEAYNVDATMAEKFDKQFAAKEKKFCLSQEEFYIHSHSVIR